MEYEMSWDFHNRHKSLYDHLVVVTMKNGEIVEGSYCDDFFEDESIMVGCNIIKIVDIEKMILSPKDSVVV